MRRYAGLYDPCEVPSSKGTSRKDQAVCMSKASRNVLCKRSGEMSQTASQSVIDFFTIGKIEAGENFYYSANLGEANARLSAIMRLLQRRPRRRLRHADCTSMFVNQLFRGSGGTI